MINRDIPDLEANQTKNSENLPLVESIMPGFNTVLKINHAVNNLIFDYTLVAAILGLIRSKTELGDILNFLTLLLLNLVMVIHIGRYWRTFKGRKVMAITWLCLSFLCAFVVAVLVRGLFSIISLFIPLINVLNASVGHAFLTWVFGKTTNHLYLRAKKINHQTLQEILNNKGIR